MVGMGGGGVEKKKQLTSRGQESPTSNLMKKQREMRGVRKRVMRRETEKRNRGKQMRLSPNIES